MQLTPLSPSGVLLLELDRHVDERGWFLEFWNPARGPFAGLPTGFVQDNIAWSRRGVLRGLHYQEPHPQGKLVTVTSGEIYDVAVDLRVGLPSFGAWVAATLTPGRALFIPEGFAHGYQVTSDDAHVLYKCTASYEAGADRTLAWNDPELAITWPVPEPILSARDAAAPSLSQTRIALAQ